MEHSYNGWPASPDLKTRVIEPVPGVSFRVVDNDNVADVFTYLAREYNARVEPLKGPVADDWSFAYRADRNDPSALSCHASGTAVDFNATKHPNGVKGTFTAAQRAEMREIITELDSTVQCGEFYLHTTDGMHWEINVPPGHLQEIGAKLRAASKPPPPKPAPKPDPKPTAGKDVDAALPGFRRARDKAKSPERKAWIQRLIDSIRRHQK